MSKIFYVTFLAWVSVWVSSTSAQEYLPPKQGGGSGGGSNVARRPVSEPTLPANYEYTYDVQDNAVSLDFGHNEKRKDDRATGSNHVLLPDGRTQYVEYEAGPDGYKPQVMYVGTAMFPTQSGRARTSSRATTTTRRRRARACDRRRRAATPCTGAPTTLLCCECKYYPIKLIVDSYRQFKI